MKGTKAKKMKRNKYLSLQDILQLAEDKREFSNWITYSHDLRGCLNPYQSWKAGEKFPELKRSKELQARKDKAEKNADIKKRITLINRAVKMGVAHGPFEKTAAIFNTIKRIFKAQLIQVIKSNPSKRSK